MKWGLSCPRDDRRQGSITSEPQSANVNLPTIACMDPTASKPRRSIRSFLRQSANKVFRQAPSSAAIQQPLATPSRCQSTLPNDHTSRTAYVGSAPAPTIESVAAPKTPGQIPQPAKGASSPAPGAPRNELPSPSGAASPPSLDESPPNADAPADPALHTGQRTTRGIWTGLEVALRAMHESAGLFPPLQSAIGTFIPCLNVLEVILKIYKLPVEPDRPKLGCFQKPTRVRGARIRANFFDQIPGAAHEAIKLNLDVWLHCQRCTVSTTQRFPT